MMIASVKKPETLKSLRRNHYHGSKSTMLELWSKAGAKPSADINDARSKANSCPRANRGHGAEIYGTRMDNRGQPDRANIDRSLA